MVMRTPKVGATENAEPLVFAVDAVEQETALMEHVAVAVSGAFRREHRDDERRFRGRGDAP